MHEVEGGLFRALTFMAFIQGHQGVLLRVWCWMHVAFWCAAFDAVLWWMVTGHTVMRRACSVVFRRLVSVVWMFVLLPWPFFYTLYIIVWCPAVFMCDM